MNGETFIPAKSPTNSPLTYWRNVKVLDDSSLPKYWDWVARSSFHLRMERPTITDIFYRHIVLNLLSQLITIKPHRILKLDAYNEATNTQYGFYMLDGETDLVIVDISGEIAKRAGERATGRGVYNMTHIIVGDFRKLPIRSSAFDMSCSFGSIEHVPQYDIAFYEQMRVVKPGGEVLVGVPNMANISMRILFTKILHMLGFMKKLTNPEKHFLERQLVNLAKGMRLVGVVSSGYHLFPKQLRWADLWMESRGVNTLHKSRLFRWLLKVITIMEIRYRFVRHFAEMIVVKGVRPPAQGIGLRSLEDEVIGIRL